MSFSLQKLKPLFWLIVVWLVLLGLTHAFSRDVFAYHCWFDDALALSSADRFFGLNGYLRDPAYYSIQAIGTMVLPFGIFFALLILGALAIKLFALLQLSPKPNLLDVLPYLLILSFLHEGTQIRVALGLSIALWAFIWFAKGRRVQAFVILCMATTFHLSVAAFFIVFILLILYERLGFWIFIVITVVAALLTYSSIVRDLVLSLGEVIHARYMAYSVGAIYRKQNSSGLFQYFSIFVAILTLLVWRLHEPSTKVWQELKKIALISGFLAVIILQVFHFNVVIASRLADLLLLPLALVLGSALVQLQKNNKKMLLWLVIAFLILYGCARGLLTYRPISGTSQICHPELQPNYDPENP